MGHVGFLASKANSAATEQITQYANDTRGSVSQVTDPFGGVTTYTYDELGRLASRTLPNSVVTSWTFDSRDRLVEIKHVDSTLADTDPNYVIASFTYTHPANAVGEPHKITREDGSYINLVYDASLRIRSETYYSSTATGNVFVREIAYEYDAQGNRTSRTATGLPEELYEISVTDGYQLARTAGADGVLDTGDDAVYTYDDGGRVTGIDRSGDPWTLSYNAAGQPTSVAGIGPADANHTYQYDALGRRVAASDGTDTIHFLVAPAAQRLGAGVLDVEVQHLAADASGNLLAAWVYAGENAILRYGSAGAGSVRYYLEDVSDSIRALVDANRQVVAQYDYDAFGILLDGSDTPTSAAGGDFGYHAAWHDEATGLYHMRARTYDTQTGRFLSPDPADGVPQAPESFNLYAFANNNPLLYSDPTGLFSIAEINVSNSIQKNLQALKNTAIQEVKEYAIDEIKEALVESALNGLSKLIPAQQWLGKAFGAFGGSASAKSVGNIINGLSQTLICETFGAPPWVAFEPGIRENGTPVGDGFSCQHHRLGDPNFSFNIKKDVRRPDILFGNHPATSKNTNWIVTEVKLSVTTLVKAYGKNGYNRGQLDAILNYTKDYTVTKSVASFLTLFKGGGHYEALLKKFQKEALTKGVAAIVISVAGNARSRT